MSLSAMPQELFEKTEFVSSDDPSIDQSELVYMGSDSEESCLLQEVVRDQQETPNNDSGDKNGNPIHVSVRDESEIARLLAIVNEKCDSDDFPDVGDLMHNGIETDTIISIIREEEIDDISFDFNEEIITKVEPPYDMPEPPEMSELFKIEEGYDKGFNNRGQHQFEMISKTTFVPKPEPDDASAVLVKQASEEPVAESTPENAGLKPNDEIQINAEHEEDKKTEEEGDSPNASIASGGDTSLVDHPYSQSETSGREFCDDLVQDLLRETGNGGNRSAVQLLTMFTGLFESYFDEEVNSQRSLYFQNMKRSLEKIKSDAVKSAKQEFKKTATKPERRSSEPTPTQKVVTFSHPRFSDVQETETEKLIGTETIDLTQIDLPPSQTTERMEDNSIITELREVTMVDDEVIEKQEPESEVVAKFKDQILRFENIGNKIVDGVKDLKVVNDNSIVELQGKLSALLRESKKEFRAISADILAGPSSAVDINEESKARLVSASTDDLSSDSDMEQIKKRRRKVPKAVVSSTKEDSDATDHEVGGVEAEEIEEMSGSDDSKDLRDPNKEIDKLLDFTTLDNAKPASSRKVSKQKKLKKLRKRKTRDSESLPSSSSDESQESSSTDNDGEKTDEEEKMRLRQNDNARDDLLADSDAVESEYSDQSGLSFLFSSDDEVEGGKKAKDKSKPQAQKLPKLGTKSSDEETSLSSEDEGKKLENGTKSLAEQVVTVDEVKAAKGDDKSGTDASDNEVKAKIRIRRDSEEREIFSKGFLDGTPAIKKPQTSNTSHAPSKKAENSQEKTPGTPPNDKGLIDLSMFIQKRNVADVDIFENRTSRHDGAGPSTPHNANKRPPSAAVQEDECIFLSSDSDSEISAPASGSGSTSTIPKRKKMLSEEELQEETKRAQKEENKRLERLKKKDERLSELMTQRLSQESSSGYEELILDYNPKTKVTISVHEKLVRSLKVHQREGIKFMYDTCFGSIGDEVKTESGCILAHCMGLGKTLQLITLLHTLITHPEQLKTEKVIVICPKSTIMNWSEEFGKWLKDIPSRNLKVFFFYKDAMSLNEKIKLVEEWFNYRAPSVFLINYEAFRYMVLYSGSKRAKIPEPEVEVKRKQEIISRCFLDPGPDLVVCDEGHTIKNQSSATNRAIVKIKTRRRIVLTGTPVQNNLNEYYSMVDWIKPALLGTVKEFNNLYANPIKDGQHNDSTPQMIKKMKQRSFILNRKLSKFVQRKEVSVLEEYLPVLYQYCLFVPLTPVQETLYENFLLLNPHDGGHQLLNDYTALRKIWTHPKVLQNAYDRAISGVLKIGENKKKGRLVDEEDNDEPDDQLDIIEGHTGVKSEWWKKFVGENDKESVMSSNKIMLLFNILRLCQMKEEKCLVFSSFVAVLNVVEYFMEKINDQRNDPNASLYGYNDFEGTSWINGHDYCRLDGSTKRENRQEMIKRFNDPSNRRLRCFLISSKAGGQGINLTGANRCVILDTSWNPSSDQQNIFRIYRLGQKNPCYVYRLIALGTMEEKVYSRSVTKQAMSGRVVDKRQIDRHYKMSELSELYVLTKTDHNARPNPQMPADEFLKFLLHTYPKQVYKYHDHERLLENKPDQDLNDDEKNEAWQLYEAELSGNPRIPLNNPLLNNEAFRTNDVLQNLNFLAAAAASSSAIDTSGLFSKFYQPPSFYPSDFLHNLLPYDLSGSYRNTLVPPATSASSSLASPGQGTSAMLRTQLNANLPPLFGPFPSLYPNLPKPTTSPKPQSAPRRRPSNTTKTPLASGASNSLPRSNGSILDRLSNEILFDTSNGSTPEKASSKDNFNSKLVTRIVQKGSLGSKNSSFDKSAASSFNPKKLVTPRPNLNIPRPQQAHLASMPSRNSSSPSNLPGTAARTHVIPETPSSAFMKVKSATSLANNQLQPGSLLLPNIVPRANTADHIYINPKTKTGSGTSTAPKVMSKNSILQSIAQRSLATPVQQSRPPISIPVPPIPSNLKPQAAKKNYRALPANVMRLPAAPNSLDKTSQQQQSPSIQRGFISNPSQKQQPSPISIQSAYSLAKDPLSAASTSSAAAQQTSSPKNLPKQSFIPQNRSIFTPQSKGTTGASLAKPALSVQDQKEQRKKIEELVAMQKKPKYTVVQNTRKPVNGIVPALNVPKPVENSVSITKIMPRSDPKFSPIPKSLISTVAGPSKAVTLAKPSQPSKPSPQSVVRINQPTIAKSLPQTINRSPVPTVMRSPSQQLPKRPSQIIVPRLSQGNAAGASNSQPRVQNSPQISQNTPHRVITGVKRKAETTLSQESVKRQALGLEQVSRVVPRSQREKSQQNTPSRLSSAEIADIVEIE